MKKTCDWTLNINGPRSRSRCWPSQAEDGDIVSAYIDQVCIGRQLKTDPVHMKVMETMQNLQRRDSNMDFEEALVKAANRQKHIIEQAASDAKQEEKDAETSEKESNWTMKNCIY